MANFLDRLVQRAWQPETALQPRTLSRFEVPRAIGLLPVAPIEVAAAPAGESSPALAGGDASPPAPTDRPAPGRRDRSERVARRPPRSYQLTEDTAGDADVAPIASAPAPVVPAVPVGRRARRPGRARQVDPGEAVQPSFAPRDSTAEPGEPERRVAALVETSRRVRTAAPSTAAGRSPGSEAAGAAHVNAVAPVTPGAPSRDATLPRRDVVRVPPAPDHAPDRSLRPADRPVRTLDRIMTAAPLEIAAGHGQAEPVIQVTIGRVEIRAVQAPRSEKRSAVKAPTLSLDEYLTRRNGGGR